jgi:multidrug transporter EmrE-like cation transporter
VISVFVAAFIAALAWMAAMTRLELSRAYPFVSLSFVLVLVSSAVFFDESLTAAKVLGVALILAGLVVGSRF